MSETMTGPDVRVELRFRPGADAAAWLEVLDRLAAWDPGLRADTVERVTDAHAPHHEPWTEALAAELGRRCAEGQPFHWSLYREAEAVRGLVVMRWTREVGVTVGLPRPSGPPEALVASLVEAVDGKARPALALYLALGTPDTDSVDDGLHALRRVPPVLYLDAAAAERARIRDALRDGPARVEDGPHGGVVVVAEGGARDGTARRLGISAEAPLVLAD